MHGTIVATGVRYNGQYYLQLAESSMRAASEQHQNCQHQWHRRLGHRDWAAIERINKEQLGTGMKIIDCGVKLVCECCLQGKSTRAPFPAVTDRKSTKVLDIVHTDVCGPMEILTPSGNRRGTWIAARAGTHRDGSNHVHVGASRWNVLQFNANLCENAQDLALHVLTTEGLDVLLLSKPYYVPRNNGNWVTDESKTVAIVVNGNRLPIQRIRHRQTLGVVAAIVSCYLWPQTGVPEFRGVMDRIDMVVRGCSRVLLAGDFNAMHLDWGSSRTCPKVLELLQLADNLGLELLNKADCLPTFKGNRADTTRFPPSRPDVTFASNVISRLDLREDSARGWRVTDVATLSDHRYVRYEVGVSPPPARDRVARRGQRPARSMVDDYSRKEQLAMRTNPLEQELLTELQAARESLRKAIRVSKNEAFDRFLLSIREDETGNFLREVFFWFQGARSAPERDPAVLRRIVDALFPVHPPIAWPDLGVGNMAPLRSIGLTQLDQIAASMHPRKAPGLDGVPNAALTVALRQQPEPFRRVFQECLDMSCFPQPWKKQRLVLLPKPGKSPGKPLSFRPICLLDNTGKALERLLLDRLNKYIEDPESPQLSEQQFGFQRGRSTLQAIQQVIDAGREAKSLGRTNNRDRRCLMVVALDVRNAFNTASGQSIAEALQAKGVPVQLCRILQDYFANRELEYDTTDGPVTRLESGISDASSEQLNVFLLYSGIGIEKS
ncbi:uncharacterized protein LOC120901083 [Anopheles arabiensis]|uniref:uncharacterized protein LOC120901083 n=1 Tax=Anopheles arabiensis TaxID=7173 RepID=UPI001AADAD31|nr:uncharacterized protein LOC120901083 [Anopheles arabiensis]